MGLLLRKIGRSSLANLVIFQKKLSVHGTLNRQLCSPAANNNCKIEAKYNFLEVSGILKKLNKSSVNDLVNMSFNFYEAEEVKKFRKENGPFRAISDLLKVPLIKEEKIETMCSQIVEKMKDKNASIKNIITPNFPDVNEDIPNVVGIMISADCSISWADVTKDYRLNNWGLVPVLGEKKKITAHEIQEAVVKAVEEIPPSKVYIFESLPSLMPQQAYIQAYIERKETQAMMLALLNWRERPGNKVFFMRSKFPTRLFKIKVGNERISSRPLVTKLLQGDSVGEKDTCRLTDINPEICETFFKLPGVHQEAYSNALILAMTFLKLIPLEKINSSLAE